MSACGSLVRFVLHHFLGDALDGATNAVVRRFTDPTRRLPDALAKANDQAWRVIELALAGDGLWTRLVKLPLATPQERAFRDEVRKFLDRHPLGALMDASFQRSALEELRAARKARLLALESLEPGEAHAAGGIERFGKPGALIDGAWEAAGRIAAKLEEAGYRHLSIFLRERSRPGLPILIAAFSHFFRQEVERDAELSRGLTFEQLQTLGQDLEAEFAGLQEAFGALGGEIAGLLDDLQAQVEDLHGAVRRIERDLRSALTEARTAGTPGLVVRPPTIAVDLGSGVALELALIPPGEFTLGSAAGERGRCDDEGPQTRTRIAEPFYLGLTPVTQGQWRQVMGENPASFKESPEHPVEHVSWDDCQEFCARLAARTGRAARLPSEAEWEYACRSGSVTVYNFGDDPALLPEHAWFNANTRSSQPVGRKPPNGFGLHDMHGNVWEWCQDPWHPNYRGIPADGRAWTEDGDEDRRVLRGGSWGNGAHGLRSACRARALRDLRQGIFGLRVAMAKAPGTR